MYNIKRMEYRLVSCIRNVMESEKIRPGDKAKWSTEVHVSSSTVHSSWTEQVYCTQLNIHTEVRVHVYMFMYTCMIFVYDYM